MSSRQISVGGRAHGRLLKTLEEGAAFYEKTKAATGSAPSIWVLVSPGAEEAAKALAAKRWPQVPFKFKVLENRPSLVENRPHCPACGLTMADVGCKLVCGCGYRET